MKGRNNLGVSVIICCYNSKKYISKTLVYLSKQEIKSDISVEIILVDNASTDNTADIAQREWEKLNSSIPFKIISESKSGLIYARETGISNAKYSYLLFCDDDNFLDTHYIQIAFDTLNNNSKIAALGGRGYPIYEKNPEDWFNILGVRYATGPQSATNGKVPIKSSFVYGAGSVYRTEMLHFIFNNGFKSYLIGRKGNKLLASEDVELCYALTLAGFEVHYSDLLKFDHIIPANRIRWEYVKMDAFGHGYSRAFLRPYQYILLNTRKYNLSKEIISLSRQCLSLFIYMIRGDKIYKNIVRNIMMNYGEAYSYVNNYRQLKNLRSELQSAKWISKDFKKI